MLDLIAPVLEDRWQIRGEDNFDMDPSQSYHIVLRPRALMDSPLLVFGLTHFSRYTATQDVEGWIVDFAGESGYLLDSENVDFIPIPENNVIRGIDCDPRNGDFEVVGLLPDGIAYLRFLD